MAVAPGFTHCSQRTRQLRDWSVQQSGVPAACTGATRRASRTRRVSAGMCTCAQGVARRGLVCGHVCVCVRVCVRVRVCVARLGRLGSARSTGQVGVHAGVCAAAGRGVHGARKGGQGACAHRQREH